jgi:uncharacterized protein (TIGR00369 family)
MAELSVDDGVILEKVMESASRLQGANHCFGCGPANAIGLQLEFSLAEDKSSNCLTMIPASYEGPPGYVHGGIIATLLDESMSKAVRQLGVTAMTRQMEIQYLRPVPSGEEIRLVGRLLQSEGRKYWTEAKILNAKGNVLAESKGLFIAIRDREKIRGGRETAPGAFPAKI